MTFQEPEVVPVATSLRSDERAELDRLAGVLDTTRAGAARAAIRFAMIHESAFLSDLKAEERMHCQGNLTADPEPMSQRELVDLVSRVIRNDNIPEATDGVRRLLEKYGVRRVTELPEGLRHSFARDVRSL